MNSLLEPNTLPVVLPSEDRPAQHRGLVTTIAVLVVLVGASAGLIHAQVWEEVGADVTRLLPASTPVFAHVERPWAQLDAALQLDRWASRSALSHAATTRGVFADGVGGRVAGVPLTVVHKGMLAADALRFAAVPTAAGTALLIFVEVQDPWARGRLRAALAPYLQSVDRVLGYDVELVTGLEPWIPWVEDGSDLRLVAMDAQLVLSLGPPEALTALLRARVTGRSQPIARREGFTDPSELPENTAASAFIDPPALYDLVAPVVGRELGDATGLRLFAADRVRAVELRSQLVGGDDRLEARVLTAQSSALAEVAEAMSPGDHRLLHRLPFDPTLAISASVGDVARLAKVAARIGRVLRVALGHPLLDGGRAPLALALLDRIAASAVGEPERTGLDGDAALAFADDVTPESWSVYIGCRDAELAEIQLHQLLERALVDRGFALGALRSDDGGTLHVVAALPQDAGTPAPTPTVYWRRAGDLLVVAPTERRLDAATAALPDRRAAAGRLGVRRALRNLQDDPVVVVVDPTPLLDAAPGAVAPLLSDLLSPSFRLAASLAVGREGFRLRTNVGGLTGLAAIAAADPAFLDGLFVLDLPEQCREAVASLCRGGATTPLCSALQPGRRAVVERACERLLAATERGEAEAPLTPP